MPIYEYHCEKCNETFEVFQKINDDPVSNCPKCNEKVKRLISNTSFSLKGGGWYKDGYSSTSSSVGTQNKPSSCSNCSKDKKSDK